MKQSRKLGKILNFQMDHLCPIHVFRRDVQVPESTSVIIVSTQHLGSECVLAIQLYVKLLDYNVILVNLQQTNKSRKKKRKVEAKK